MALFHSHFFSDVLGMQSEAIVIVPQAASERQIGVETVVNRKLWPCLWLLHGMSDDHTIWLRRTSIERYAEAAGCAVVMPNCHRSFYTDMKQGGDYWTFLSEELPTLMRSFFPLSERREDNAVAGLSMGGYGAFKWLLRKPEHFIAGASLSGALDMSSRMKRLFEEEPDRMMARSVELAFGREVPTESMDDLSYLLEKCQQPEALPKMFQLCGTEDFLYEDNLLFKKNAESAGVPLTYRERPGAHEWGFWDEGIQDVLAWLPQQGFGLSD
jgi:S-formylglutathione hydrolase FrmB